jgi:hypothetical protein
MPKSYPILDVSDTQVDGMMGFETQVEGIRKYGIRE